MQLMRTNPANNYGKYRNTK